MIRWRLPIPTIVTVFLIGWALAMAGRFVSSPAAKATKADLIVALGGGGGIRIREVHGLYAKGYAPQFLITGIEFGDPALRPAYLEWRAAFLTTRGVPADAMLFDAPSVNSWEEAINAVVLMQRRVWHSVLVVSDPPHLRRLSWVWGKAFAGSGLEYRLIASSMPGWEPQQWWTSEKSGQFVLMELIKLSYYLIKY